jgi:hypothetical protein
MALCSFGHALEHLYLFYVVERCLGAWWGIAWGPRSWESSGEKDNKTNKTKLAAVWGSYFSCIVTHLGSGIARGRARCLSIGA